MTWVCDGCEYENELEDATCAACEEPRPAQETTAAADDDDFKCFRAGRIVSCEDIAGTKLKKMMVDVGEAAPINVVTSAPNVAEGQVVCIACVGATIKGEPVIKTNIKGATSNGMVCDTTMLRWTGGGAGVAVLLSADYPLGSRPPTSRPRGDGH